MSSNQFVKPEIARSITDQITELWQKSTTLVRPRALTEDQIGKVRRFLFEFCPKKMLFVINELQPAFQSEQLAKTCSIIEELKRLLPRLSTAAEIAAYRKLYRRDFRDYCADNDVLLLPNGVIEPNERLYQNYQTLSDELEQLLWSITDIRFILCLMVPPYGDERSFPVRILNTLMATMTEIINDIDEVKELLCDYMDKRAKKISRPFLMPQTEDAIMDFELWEKYLFGTFELQCHNLQYWYGELYQFGVKNRETIEEIFTDALLHHANYGK